uniref:Uncharacterized protein n=1 Tax=Chromera velia CCMP2878 TaxID=1169474 RepID=A0A0G4H1C1_9ALVE|eukprot:Cvel_24284.t1-p1 / transcript=Cvel_24284.t1 / gene=Cvel_24284 / organism=Chromera_velia_CCMP2878 / gene_product=hypothetical protein / transcript_product=hypothetical protein / location=Cvel_scaffold2605:15246-15581(-) / protein_length=112 / sequence_SO=supercontig / SO=protein_coding / is_pseudo=false
MAGTVSPTANVVPSLSEKNFPSTKPSVPDIETGIGLLRKGETGDDRVAPLSLRPSVLDSETGKQETWREGRKGEEEVGETGTRTQHVHLHWLDLVRFFAVVTVVCGHLDDIL